MIDAILADTVTIVCIGSVTWLVTGQWLHLWRASRKAAP